MRFYGRDFEDNDYPYRPDEYRRRRYYSEPYYDSSSGCMLPFLIIMMVGFVFIYNKTSFDLTTWILIIGAFAILAGIAIFLTRESWTIFDLSKFKSTREKTKKDVVDTAVSDLDLKKELESYVSTLLNSKSVEDSVTNRIQKNLENSIIDKLLDRFKIAGDKLQVFHFISEELFTLSSSTEKYIIRLNKNSIVNLMIGITGTCVAIFILGASAYNNTYSDPTSFTINFLPKIGFAVFIQIFSYFFLRLYKGNLEDTKYFQNELTNINSKISAIKIAYALEEKEKLISLVVDLSQTERNFKLQKEESTVNLEKARIEKDIDINFIDSLKTFMSTYKSK